MVSCPQLIWRDADEIVTRTGFDMDPFVVISLGRKTYRTRVVRHNLNPVFDEKLVFQVARHETSYSIGFSVVDRDTFSGNDYVGKVDIPLEKIINFAPEPEPTTGLFAIPDGMITPNPEAKKSRFRLPLSRSASSQSLSKQARMTPSREPSAPNLLVPLTTTESLPQPPTSQPPTSDAQNLADASRSLSVDDDSLRPFILPLNLKHKDKWPDKKSTLYIRAKYVPYLALRQQFWRAMLRQYDADESARIDKVELTTMLDSLGSTLHESTIDGFFARFPAETPQGELPSLSFDEAVICLEDQLSKTSKNRPTLSHTISSLSIFGLEGSESGTATPSLSQSMAGFTLSPDAPDMGEEPPALEPLSTMESHGLSDGRDEEHVIEIRECPICHQPRLNKRSDSDIVTHIATCASQDWRKVNNIVMGGFVTASQAQRKWYSKVVTKISYGGYRLGANSANILVQDRVTGQINEEKMSVYVRLGIRLLYKGLKANNMEMKRSE
jgi:phosphatidylserine decarboxylase